MNELTELFESLNGFPHVRRKVEGTWGSRVCRNYLCDLLVDSRDRNHTDVQGFPVEVFNTLNTLLEMHDTTYPAHIPVKSIWDEAHKRT